MSATKPKRRFDHSPRTEAYNARVYTVTEDHGRSGEFTATAAEVASEYHILYSGLTGTGKTAGQTCVILCGI